MNIKNTRSGKIVKTLVACTAVLVLVSSSANAQLTVKKTDIKDNLYVFKATGEALKDVGGALETNNNVAFNAWEFPDGANAGSRIFYLYADSKANTDQASFVLKWDFSESGHLVTEVEIPHNRFYFQYESASSVTEVMATISYSVDGKNWIELDQFNPDISGLNPEQPVKFQDNPLYVSLEKPAKTFYYKVEFRVTGGPFCGQAFQWQRMGLEPEIMRPDFFSANFTVKPNP